MKSITYAGDTFTTGDAIAAAVMEYGKILADAGTADTVTLPIITADGAESHATLLLGPASQMVAESAPDATDELRDDELVARLNGRIRGFIAADSALDDPDMPTWVDET